MKKYIVYVLLIAVLGLTLVLDFVLYKKLLEQKASIENLSQVLIYTGIVEPGESGKGVVNKVIRFKDLPPQVDPQVTN
jgi:hypothetical protein